MNPRDPGTLALVAAGGAPAYLTLRSRRPSEAYDFRHRTVVITGGSRGLGLLLARQLTAQGENRLPDPRQGDTRRRLVSRDLQEERRTARR